MALVLSMSKTTYEEYLDKNGKLIYRNVGVSMLPLIKQGRDFFIVEKKSDKRCKKYDVVLYKKPHDVYILHRIIDVNENDYTIRGDNCILKEYAIKDEDIIGVMTSFIRKGKEYSVENRFYKIYSVIWCKLFFLRRFCQKFIYH